MSFKCHPTVFVQLQRFKRLYGKEVARLYNELEACLTGRQDCPMRPARNGRKKLTIGSYRVIVRETDEGWEVLRLYRMP